MLFTRCLVLLSLISLLAKASQSQGISGLMNTSIATFASNAFFKDARVLIKSGKHPEALKVLDDRIRKSHEIPPNRLAEYYCCRLCLALSGDIPCSVSDYRAFVSYSRRKSLGKSIDSVP